MSCFSFCKSVGGPEHQVNYVSNITRKPEDPRSKDELLNAIESFNKELNNPVYRDDEGNSYHLDYATLMNPENPPYLFKLIVKDHYIKNTMKITRDLEDKLENMCTRVKDLRDAQRPSSPRKSDE
jgi:hypothetical protein